MKEFTFDDLLSLTSIIQTKRIRDGVIKRLTEAPAYFRVVPSSATGKYHPKYTLGIAGLVRHSAATVLMANHICNLDFVKVTPYQRDIILAAAFLHDICKKGTGDEPDQDQFNDHARLAAERINDGTPAFKKISRLVLIHMGQWGNNKPANLHEFILHLADYLASRKNITVSLTEED